MKLTLKKFNIKYITFIIFSAFFIFISLLTNSIYFVSDLVIDYEVVKSFESLNALSFLDSRYFFGSILYNLLTFINVKLFNLSLVAIKITNVVVSYLIYCLSFFLLYRKKEFDKKDIIASVLFSIVILNIGNLFEYFSNLEVKLTILSSLIIYLLLEMSDAESGYKKYLIYALALLANILAFSFYSLVIIALHLCKNLKNKNKIAYINDGLLASIFLVPLGINFRIFSNVSLFSYSFKEIVSTSLCSMLLPTNYYQPNKYYSLLFIIVSLFVLLTFLAFIYLIIKKSDKKSIFIISTLCLQLLLGMVFYSPDNYYYQSLFVNNSLIVAFGFYHIYEVSKKEKPLNLYNDSKFNFSAAKLWCIVYIIAIGFTYSYSFESRIYTNKDIQCSKSDIYYSLAYNPESIPSSEDMTIFGFSKGTYVEAIDYFVNENYFSFIEYDIPNNPSYTSFETCNRVYGFYYDIYEGDNWVKQRCVFEFYIENPFLEIEVFEPEVLDNNVIEVRINNKVVKSKLLSDGSSKIVVDVSSYLGETVLVTLKAKNKFFDPDLNKEVGLYISSISTKKMAGVYFEEDKGIGWATDEFYYSLDSAKDEVVIKAADMGYFAENKAKIYINNQYQKEVIFSPGFNDIIVDTSKFKGEPIYISVIFNNYYEGEDDARKLTVILNDIIVR